jgi:hypothetical protein
VSEPPEQEEEPDEPAADADLEELLEQFREPEEAPRPRANPLWLVSAILLSVLACWLALRASGGGAEEKPKSAALAGAMLPGKTSERLPRDEEPVDVVEDYLARCKKGMTAQEVRWIVEDFRRAGLDAPPQGERTEKFVAARLEQHRWYLDLLADGLALDAEQRRVASEKLWLLADEATQRVAKELMEHDASVEKLLEKQPEILRDLIDANRWLEDERYAPWDLCELTKEQVRLTWFEWVNSRRNAEPDSLTYEPDMPWFDDRMVVGGPSEGGGWTIADFPTGDAPTAINGAGSILPFIAGQTFRKGNGDGVGSLEDQAMGCHPAQLKSLLLLAPNIASRLLERLDETGE